MTLKVENEVLKHALFLFFLNIGEINVILGGISKMKHFVLFNQWASKGPRSAASSVSDYKCVPTGR